MGVFLSVLTAPLLPPLQFDTAVQYE